MKCWWWFVLSLAFLLSSCGSTPTGPKESKKREIGSVRFLPNSQRRELGVIASDSSHTPSPPLGTLEEE